MQTRLGVRRVIIVVLDGLRPDAIDRFGLVHAQRLIDDGASSLSARTVTPSVTAAAITSLLTGVSPALHGIRGDRVFIPRSPAQGLVPLPEVLSVSGFPTSAFMGDVPTLFKGIAARVGRRLGFGTLRLSGRCADEILAAAKSTIRSQRRGMIMLHWPDADVAGHASGWMSGAYARACHALDNALGALISLIDLENSQDTMLVAVADHGGGGTVRDNHESDHPFDWTIPLILAGRSVVPAQLADAALVDVAPTVLWSLGLRPPPSYEGRVLHASFATYTEPVAMTNAVA